MSIFGHVHVEISRKLLTNFEHVYSFGRGGSSACFFQCESLDILATWPRKWGSKWAIVVDEPHKSLISILAKVAEA